MEITWIREGSFDIEKSNVKGGGGLTLIFVSVFGGHTQP